MTDVMEQTATSTLPEGCVGISEDVFAPMPHAGRRFTPNYRTLCSIWPDKLETTMMHGGKRQAYRLPAAPKGKYALLRAYDTWTLTRNYAIDGPAEEAMQQSPVSCEGLATDLLREWAQDAPGNKGGSQPGIMVIAGDVPTQAELDQLQAIQTEYFRYLVRAADDYWITGQRSYITDDHRRALRWLGSEDREWFKKIAAVIFKKCPNCAEDIHQDALGCKHCSANLLKFYREAGFKDDEITAEDDAAVAAFYANRKTRVAANNKEVRAKHEAGA